VRGVLTATSYGTCFVTATKAATVDYLVQSSAQTTITFSQANQATLVISTTSATGTAYSATLGTTGGSGTGAVTYAAVNGTASGCAISGTNLSATTTTSTVTCLVTATKAADNDYLSNSSVQTTFTFYPVPAGLSISTTPSSSNAGTPGTGDVITLTYNEPVTASSIWSTWSGSSTAMYVYLTRGASGATTLDFCAADTCTASTIGLGSINLGDTGFTHYLPTNGTAYLNATIVMSTSGTATVVTITLGSKVSGSTISAVTTNTTLAWTPSAAALNPDSVSSATTVVDSASKENF
jgi:hypothetical protein